MLRLAPEPRFRHDPDETWWIGDANCLGIDPELFFPVGMGPEALAQEARAKAVCRGCEVRSHCLEWSLATYQDAGIWGGLGEEERREIRRARRRARTAARAS